MEYRFRFDPREHHRAMRAVHRLGGGWRREAAFALGVACILVGWTLARHGAVTVADLWPLLLYAVLAFGVLPLLTRWRVARIPRTDPTVQGEMRRVVSAEGVDAHGNGVSMHFAWDGVRRAVETGEFFLLFYAPRAACYIPKRAVPSDEVPRLRAHLADRLAGRAQLLPA